MRAWERVEKCSSAQLEELTDRSLKDDISAKVVFLICLLRQECPGTISDLS